MKSTSVGVVHGRAKRLHDEDEPDVAPMEVDAAPRGSLARRGPRLPVVLVSLLCAGLTFCTGLGIGLKLERSANVTPTPTPSSHPWLVFTMQRSGSRWFVDSAAERATGTEAAPVGSPQRVTEIMCAEQMSLDSCCAPYDALSVQTCAAQLDAKRMATLAPGFKWMLDFVPSAGMPHNFTTLAHAVCQLDMPFVFMWRRNVLRRLISYEANQHDHLNPALVEHEAHPRTEREAEVLRAYRPRLNASELLGLISDELRTQYALQAAFVRLAATCSAAAVASARIFYYEDLVDSNPGSANTWGEVLQALRVWKRSEMAVIHGATPVLETVDNPREVYLALNGSEHEWMLRV